MFTLTTDTSCDELRGDLESRNISWVPLTFTIDGVTYPDDFRDDDRYRDFYAKVRGGAMPSTSQISAYEHEEFFRKVAEGGAKEIVHLTLSSGLSSTYQSARMGAHMVMEQFPDCKIHVVDSLGATQVHGYVLDRAEKLRDEGMPSDQASAILRELTKRVHVLFTVDSLTHLRRGGRISGAAAAIGTLLNIKPIFTFDCEGKLRVTHKAKGARRALEYCYNYIKEWAPNVKTVYIAQGDARDKAEEVAAQLRAQFGCDVHIGWCGPVIGAHTGAGIIGLIFESEKVRPL